MSSLTNEGPGHSYSSATATGSDGISRAAVWTGRILSLLGMLFLAVDALMKVLRVQAAVDGTTQLGYAEGVIVPLGILQLVCLALYAVPRTSALGAVLWTGN